MAIVPVVNGQVIEKTGITTMHSAVRTAVNGMSRADLQRFTFNKDQTDNIYVAAGSWDTLSGPPAPGTPFRVDKEIDHTDVVDADLTTATMDLVMEWDPGSITTSMPPCIVVITVDFDTTGWEPASGIDYARHAGVFALSVSFSDAPVAHEFPDGDLTSQGIVRARPDAMADHYPIESTDSDIRTLSHVPGGIVAVYDASASPTPFTIHRIALWAAACRCGGSALVSGGTGPAYFSVPRATINLFAIRTS